MLCSHRKSPIGLPEGALPYGTAQRGGPAVVPRGIGQYTDQQPLLRSESKSRLSARFVVVRHLLAIEGAYGFNEVERGWLREEEQLCPCKPTLCCTRLAWPLTAKIIVRNATRGYSHQIGRNISMSVVCGTRGRAKNAVTNLKQRSSFPRRHKRCRAAKLQRHPRALHRHTADICAIVH